MHTVAVYSASILLLPINLNLILFSDIWRTVVDGSEGTSIHVLDTGV